MFEKAALILPVLASLTLADLAQAGSAVVISNNGCYGAAWGQFFTTESAIAKATQLCQQKGGINIKVLVSRGADPATGMYFCSIAASGHGPGAVVGAGYGTVPPQADAAAFVDCRQKGGASPHIVTAWKERGYDGVQPGTRAGKF